jgi:hypothetical protein
MRCVKLPAVQAFVIAAVLARGESLVEIWHKKINRTTVSAPFAGMSRLPIWAVAFSNDVKSLAVGVGLVASRNPPFNDYRSYVLIYSTEQPESPPRVLETKLKPWDMRPEMAWSPDSKRIALSPLNIEDPMYFVDIETGTERTIPRDRCTLMGVIDGNHTVLACLFGAREPGPSIRVLDSHGALEHQWIVPKLSVGAGFASNAGWAGVAIPDRDNPSDHHEVIAIRAADGAEVGSWRVSESWAYRGALSASGAIFCELLADGKDWRLRTLACRDSLRGQDIGKLQFELGRRGSTHIAIGGTNVTAEEWHWIKLPLPEPYTYTEARPGHRVVWNMPSGRALARWAIRSQRILPNGFQMDCPYSRQTVNLSPKGARE